MAKVNDYNKFSSLRQKKLLNGEIFSHKFVEKPMMKKLMPKLTNKKVLLLGCGSGEESIIIKKAGAKKIIGIDISVAAVRLARETYPEHEFRVGNMNKLKFENNSFDFVYSSLSLHYSKFPKRVYKEIYRVLRPGGELLFSIGHPIRWASKKVNINGAPIHIIGFSNNDKLPRIYGNYASFAEHKHNFPSGEVLKFWVGSPSFHFGLLKGSGFTIENFSESKAIMDCKKIRPHYYKRFSEFPQFMAFLAKK
jgi:ubiquinone/menaquinone biosynthesis C-methylase UbiE